MSILARIMDKIDPVPDWSEAAERTFKYCLTKVKISARMYVEPNRFGYRIRPACVPDFKKVLDKHGLEHCERSKRAVEWMNESANNWLVIDHRIIEK
jgi:hypothetical protein